MKLKDSFKILKNLCSLEKELESRNLELKEVEDELSKKRQELESLKTELVELKDFIHLKFKRELEKYDYEVNIKNCYIVSHNGKKYITVRIYSMNKTNVVTNGFGRYVIEKYEYFDALHVEEHKYKFLFEYQYGHFLDNSSSFVKYDGHKPDYEEHILNVNPELSQFADDKVPNTYLQKIYYEINNLGTKKLIMKRTTDKK